MLITVVLPLILAFIMFSLGLGLRGSDFTRILKFPKAFTVGLCNQLLLLPIIGFLIATLFKLPPELAVGTMIIALCPGGVTSNVLTRIAKGNTPLSISMTAVASLISIITVPILVAWSANHFMGTAAPEIDITKLGLAMFLLTAIPVGIGMLLTKLAPTFVEKSAKLISNISVALFVLIVIAALAVHWTVVSAYFSTIGPALILLNITLLILGLITAKILRLNRSDATTISIESGVQNASLGITVGALIVITSGDNTLPLMTIPSAVYGLTMYFVTIPFIFWRAKK